ncbi:MAG: hypothetical protein LCH76_02940 [Actinobacteria bacterium]|nr:hypothetical protein [Actinomycetota bacterium]
MTAVSTLVAPLMAPLIVFLVTGSYAPVDTVRLLSAFQIVRNRGRTPRRSRVGTLGSSRREEPQCRRNTVIPF